MKNEKRYYVYILSNQKRNVLYVGLSNNIARRIIEHKEGLGCQFSKKYNLKFLLYYEIFEYIFNAIEREKEIKKWRREKKDNLIACKNKNLIDLSSEIFDYYGIGRGEYNEIKNLIIKDLF